MFGRKNKEIESIKEELAYIRGKLESLTTRPQTDTEDEVKSDWARLKKKVDQMDKISIMKKIEKIEKRLGIGKENYQEETEEPLNTNPNLSNPDSLDIPALLKNIPLPLRMTISMLLRQKYGVSLDEVVADPTKAIPILTDIMNSLNTLNQKKAEAQKEGKPFNPYDPTLFVRS